MTSAAQIHANRENAKHSTGPTSSQGAATSSRNAVKHGLTGQTLVLTPEEAESYSEHVREYMLRYEPADHYQRQLIQDLADSDWGIHQIFLLQSSTISYMQTLSRRLAAATTPEAEAEILTNDRIAVRKLATLNSYENRKRRASRSLREQIEELAFQEPETSTAPKPMQTKPEPEIGFVCPEPQSVDELTAELEALEAEADLRMAHYDAVDAANAAKTAAMQDQLKRK